VSKKKSEFRRPQVTELAQRLAAPRRFLQVVAGPSRGGGLCRGIHSETYTAYRRRRRGRRIPEPASYALAGTLTLEDRTGTPTGEEFETDTAGQPQEIYESLRGRRDRLLHVRAWMDVAFCGQKKAPCPWALFGVLHLLAQSSPIHLIHMDFM
jgi:hypothetical protein